MGGGGNAPKTLKKLEAGRQDLGGLREEPFVMVSPRQKLRLVADQILKNAGIMPDICCTTKSMETVKRLVAAGGRHYLPSGLLSESLFRGGGACLLSP